MHATTVEQPGARYMHFPRDYRSGYDMEYFRGLISEKMVIHRRMGRNTIVWEQTYLRNEPLDMRNYARACYCYFNWDFDKAERTLNGVVDAQPITRAQAEKKKRKTVISGGIKI